MDVEGRNDMTSSLVYVTNGPGCVNRFVGVVIVDFLKGDEFCDARITVTAGRGERRDKHQ